MAEVVGGGHWWGVAGHILPLLLFAVFIGVIVWAVLRMTASRPASVVAAAPDAALQELRVRYARGEVDHEDFARRARDLGAPASSVPAPPPADDGS
jgi:putative membrane protein